MDSCFVENPVEEMLSCGLLSLVRAAMDEKEENLVMAATHCLASLIGPEVVAYSAGLDPDSGRKNLRKKLPTL